MPRDCKRALMNPSQLYVPHTDADASVTSFTHPSTACVWHGNEEM